MSNSFDINQSVSSELVNYVFSNIPDTITTNLEKAIAIYVILCRTLKYDPDYAVYSDVNRTNQISDVTPTNNNVVCYHFASIYYQLLRMVGIKAKLQGTTDNHMFVSFNYQDMIITCDPTKCGHYSFGYSMTDITNVRFGYLLNGFTAMPFGMEIDKVEEVKKGLNKTVKDVYKKLGINYGAGFRINEVLNKIYNREDDRSSLYNGDRILRMIDSINCFTFLKDCDVENAQLLNKLVASLFRDIQDHRSESIVLYKETDKGVRITNLLVVYDEQMVPYYNLLIDGKLVKVNVAELYEYLVKEGWFFRSPPDIDALNLTDKEQIEKLYK